MTCTGSWPLAVGHGNTQERKATFTASGADGKDEKPSDAKDDKAKKDGPAAGSGDANSLTIDQLREDPQVLKARAPLKTRSATMASSISSISSGRWSRLRRLRLAQEQLVGLVLLGIRVASQVAKGGRRLGLRIRPRRRYRLRTPLSSPRNLLQEFKKATLRQESVAAKGNPPVKDNPGGSKGNGPINEKPKDDLPDDAKTLGREMVTSNGSRRQAIIAKLRTARERPSRRHWRGTSRS